MGRYLFFSHDGYGLGHVRRNSVIAQALQRAEPNASVTLVTGVPNRPAWLERWGRRVVRVPPLLKDGQGRYRPLEMSFEEAVARRAAIFSETVDRVRPHVVVVDRHPFGTVGELREGLEMAARRGSALVLGLRDILDDPAVISDEMKRQDWAEVPTLFAEVLVYGARWFCDHQEEYGLQVPPAYCGWVVDSPAPGARDSRQLAGYNSTFEAILAGHRSVLVPRRHPRREQAIRAERLAGLGLVDVVEPDASPEDLVRLLNGPRTISPATVTRSGIDMRGADRAAAWIRRVAEGVRAA